MRGPAEAAKLQRQTGSRGSELLALESSLEVDPQMPTNARAAGARRRSTTLVPLRRPSRSFRSDLVRLAEVSHRAGPLASVWCRIASMGTLDQSDKAGSGIASSVDSRFVPLST